MAETTTPTGQRQAGPLKLPSMDWREMLHQDGLQLGAALVNLQRDIAAGKAARTATDASIQAGLPAIQDTVGSIADTIGTELRTDGDYVPNAFSSGELHWETVQLTTAYGSNAGESIGTLLREEQEYQTDAAAAQAAEANGDGYDPEAGTGSTSTAPESTAPVTPEPGAEATAEPQVGGDAQTSQPQSEPEGGGGFGAAMEKAAALLGLGLAARTTARAFAPQRFTAAKPSIPTISTSVPTAKFKAATTAKRVVNNVPATKAAKTKPVVAPSGKQSPQLLTQKSFAPKPQAKRTVTVAAAPATTTPHKGPQRKGPGSSGPGSPAV